MPRVSLKDEVIRLTREVAELRGSVAYQTLEQDIGTLKQRVEDRDNEIEKLRDELLDAESEIGRLNRAYSKPVDVLLDVIAELTHFGNVRCAHVAKLLDEVLRQNCTDVERCVNCFMEVLKDE